MKKKFFIFTNAVIAALLLSGCNMSVEISSEAPDLKIDVTKPKGAEFTAGATRQKTTRGYIFEAQLGHPLGTVISTTQKKYTVLHSVSLDGTTE